MTFQNPWGAPYIPLFNQQYVQNFPYFIGSTNRVVQVPSSKNKYPTQLPYSRGSWRKPKPNNYGVGRTMEGMHMIINNIPKDFRSVDLRSFFSQFIETSGFVCFHFIHRPETHIPTTAEQNPESVQFKFTTTCCVIKVDAKRASEFIELYNGKHWIDKDGATQSTRCVIKNIVVYHSDEAFDSQKKKRIPYKIHVDCDRFSDKDLNRFGEMRPPSCMPNGNVGTKISQLEESNNACKLPPKYARKLGLELPRAKGNSHHQGQELADKWDNHNAHHNDMTEEGIKRLDCDKKARAGNRLEIQVKKGVRDDTEAKVDHLHEFAAFDKYGNGFGRKLMEALGWKEGQGIGKNCSGMSEPLMNDGKKPTDKKGLGFHGKKLDYKFHPKKMRKNSDKSEEPLSVSSNDDPQATSSQHCGFMYTSNSEAKYQRKFIKGPEYINKQ